MANKPTQPDLPQEQLLAAFRDFAEGHFQESRQRWEQQHQQALSDFREMLERCRERLEALPADPDHLSELWEELGRSALQVKEWLQALAYLPPERSLSEALAKLPERLDTYIQSLPREARLLIPADYWEADAGDGLYLRGWKANHRYRKQLRALGTTWQNFFRKLFKRAPRDLPAYYRRFSQHDFVRFYLGLPYQDFLSREWQHYLQRAANDLADLHGLHESLNQQFLFEKPAENSEAEKQGAPAATVDAIVPATTAWANATAEDIRAAQAGFQTIRAGIDRALEALEQYHSASQVRFGEWYHKTIEVFREKWHYAGTFMLRGGKFGPAPIGRINAHLRQQFMQRHGAWQHHFSGEQQDWQHLLSLQHIQLSTGSIYLNTMQAYLDKLNRQIIPPFENTRAVFDASLKAFQAIAEEEPERFRRKIISENRQLLKKLREDFLPAMMEPLLRNPVESIAQLFLHQIETAVRALPEEQLVFKKRDLTHLPPRSEIEDVPIKELLERRTWIDFRTKLEAYLSQTGKKVERILQDISELDQIVEFNLEAALNSLKTDKVNTEEAHRVVREGLERARGKISGFVDSFHHDGGDIRTHLFDLAYEFIIEIEDLLESKSLLELNFQLARTKAREQIQHYRHQAWLYVKRAIPIVWGYIKQAVSNVTHYYRRFRKITGLAAPAGDTQEKVYDLLHRAQLKLAGLPYIYQQLFKLEPLSDSRFLVGRDAELETMKADFNAWQAGKFMTSVIIGERGSGRTTVLNFAEKNIYQHMPVLKINFNNTIFSPVAFIPYMRDAFKLSDPSNVSDLEKALLELERPTVCIVENLQNLFLKTVDGFELLEEFIALLTSTHRRVYWVISCTLYSWNYLEKVLHISRYFQRIISLGALGQADVESIILKRHRVTGYELVFEVPPQIQDNRRFKKLAGSEQQQQYLRDLLFEQLHKFAAGNISVAMLFWLNAIQKFENNQMIISPTIELDYAFLGQLSADELFTLGSIIQHELLVVEEHMKIFRQSHQDSLMMLRSLYNRGILEETPGGYRVHPMLYRPVIQVLKQKYILH